MKKIFLVTIVFFAAQFASTAQTITINMSALPMGCIFNNVVYATSVLPLNNCMQLTGNMFPVNGGTSMSWPDLFHFNGGLGGWAVEVNTINPSTTGAYKSDHFFLDCGGTCHVTADVSDAGGGCIPAPTIIPLPPCTGAKSLVWINTGGNITITTH